MTQPPLIKSRKFWIMTVDGLATLGVYFATKYFAPSAAEDVIKILAVVQPIILAVVASITVQNVAAMKNRSNVARFERENVKTTP